MSRCGCAVTYQQHCFTSNHIIGSFVRIEAADDRSPLLPSIMIMLSALLDSDVRDLANDTAVDVSVYIDLCRGLRALEKLHGDPRNAAVLQACISSVDSRIPQSRSRASSYSSSVHDSLHSSPSSSRAASPAPPLAHDASAAAQLSLSSAAASSRVDALARSLAHVPIADSLAQPPLQPAPSTFISPAAPPPYTFTPSPPVLPAALKILALEIDDVCEGCPARSLCHTYGCCMLIDAAHIGSRCPTATGVCG